MMTASICILTYNRQSLVNALVRELQSLAGCISEIVVVDNCSTPPVQLSADLHEVPARVIRLDSNIGAAGRNDGILSCRSDIVITLDDDICGLTVEIVRQLLHRFEDRSVAAVCFKVLDAQTRKQINWCHRQDIDTHADDTFITCEISEGAVAFRREDVVRVGMYPLSFFISHEGPDLAFRLLNNGLKVIYEPQIAVLHSTDPAGRATWRRYYFDTRNVFWVAARNFPLSLGVRRVFVQVGAMFVYSLRDGFLKYWLKGVLDGLGGLGRALTQREAPRRETVALIREIDRQRPSVRKMIARRLGQRTVRI